MWKAGHRNDLLVPTSKRTHAAAADNDADVEGTDVGTRRPVDPPHAAAQRSQVLPCSQSC